MCYRYIYIQPVPDFARPSSRRSPKPVRTSIMSDSSDSSSSGSDSSDSGSESESSSSDNEKEQVEEQAPHKAKSPTPPPPEPPVSTAPIPRTRLHRRVCTANIYGGADIELMPHNQIKNIFPQAKQQARF